jgi:hypothetical protein
MTLSQSPIWVLRAWAHFLSLRHYSRGRYRLRVLWREAWAISGRRIRDA